MKLPHLTAGTPPAQILLTECRLMYHRAECCKKFSAGMPRGCGYQRAHARLAHQQSWQTREIVGLISRHVPHKGAPSSHGSKATSASRRWN
jgi:hypothetical protein